MAESITITLRALGPLRHFFPSPLQVQVPAGTPLHEIKRQVIALVASDPERVAAVPVIRASAFATEARVLDDQAALTVDGAFVLLPPVSGG